jgi:DNA-binding NtrC family response regulator
LDIFPSTSESKATRAPAPVEADVDSLSVLVVDDEKNVREGLARVLARKGYRTRVAADTDQAIAAMRQEGFDAVITDLRMPGRDGLELLREAKELWPQVHFIIMTAYGEIASYLEARHHGAVEYFNKPVRIDDLIAVLTSIRYRQMQRRHGESDTAGPAARRLERLPGRGRAEI